MVSIMSKYQKPDIKQMFLVLQVDFFCLNIAIPQLLTKSPLPLGNNNYNPIMSTYLGPRMKLICFYLRLVRGGGGPIPLKHNYDHNNHQVSPLLTHTCLGTDKLKHNRSIHFLDAIGGNKYNFSTWFFLTNELPQP